jgi:hypothetical protein
MDGTAGIGASSTWARADHTHPAITTVPNQAAGDADTSIANTAFVAAAVATALNDVGRNLIHNSMFNVQQRGVGPWTAFLNYTADRWQLGGASDGISVILTPVDDTFRTLVGDQQPNTFLAANVTGNAGAGAYSTLQQPIEGLRRLSGKTVTLSFWGAVTSGTAKLGINYLQDCGTGGSPSLAAWNSTTGQSVTLSTTWTRFSVTTAIASAAGKTTGTNGNDCTRLAFAFSSGATNNTLFGGIGVQTANFYFWGVQLELGTVATPLEKLDPVTQLQQCQRFFQVGHILWGGYVPTGAIGTFYAAATLSVPMRAVPATLALVNDVSANFGTRTIAATGLSTVYVSAPVGTTNASGVFNTDFTASADL